MDFSVDTYYNCCVVCIAVYRLRRTTRQVAGSFIMRRMCFDISWNLFLGHSPRSFLLH